MSCWLINKESDPCSYMQFIPIIFEKCGKYVNKIVLFTSKCIQWIYRPTVSEVVLFDVSCGVTSHWGCRYVTCTVKTSRIATDSVVFHKLIQRSRLLSVCLSVQVVLTQFIQIYMQTGRRVHLLAHYIGRTFSTEFSQHDTHTHLCPINHNNIKVFNSISCFQNPPFAWRCPFQTHVLERNCKFRVFFVHSGGTLPNIIHACYPLLAVPTIIMRTAYEV